MSINAYSSLKRGLTTTRLNQKVGLVFTFDVRWNPNKPVECIRPRVFCSSFYYPARLAFRVSVAFYFGLVCFLSSSCDNRAIRSHTRTPSSSLDGLLFNTADSQHNNTTGPECCIDLQLCGVEAHATKWITPTNACLCYCRLFEVTQQAFLQATYDMRVVVLNTINNVPTFLPSGRFIL